MPIPREICDHLLNLSMHSKPFQAVMAYWEEEDKKLVTEILSPMTDVATREILVRVRDLFRREVLDSPRHALIELEKQKEK